MAIAACEDAIDQVAAAFDQIGIGARADECDRCENECRCDTEQRPPPSFVAASIHARGTPTIRLLRKCLH
jgi:hypothetical protein